MNYCVVLSAGSGSRVKSIDFPKQYFKINNIPIIIYTLRRIIDSNCFDYIYLVINNECHNYVNSLLQKFIEEDALNKIIIVYGGKERIDSIHNVVEVISENKIQDNDIIVIHDGVRPFVTDKIIKDNIEGAKKYGAVVTSVSAIDTILKSDKGDFVNEIPIRKTLYNGQSPDSFNLKTFIELENNLTERQKELITGTSQICTLNNFPIKMVEGDTINFKITTDTDLDIAKTIIYRKEGLE